jgi:Cu/Ag efflux pump CusA
VSGLPPHLRPPKNKIKQLDAFRRSLEIDDDEVFMMLIGSTKWAAIKAQEETRDQLRRDLPHYSDEELWRAVIVCRLGAKLNLAATNLSLGIDSDDSEALSEKMESMDEIMKGVTSWDDVINYVLQMDKESFSRDPMGVKAELDRMLAD